MGIEIITGGNIYLNGLFVLLIGLVISYLVSFYASLIAKKRSKKPELGTAIYRLFFYPLMFATLILSIHNMGFNMTSLLAAGGILAIAIGFAAQKSFSNVISGVFLVFDRRFKLGDTVRIRDYEGIITDIKLLSTTLRTFDNRIVSIPNENIITSETINVTKLGKKRVAVPVSIAYSASIPKARKVALEVMKKHADTLDDPEPHLLVMKMGDNGVELEARAWVPIELWWRTERALTEQIKLAFDKNKIEIPFPQRSVWMRK